MPFKIWKNYSAISSHDHDTPFLPFLLWVQSNHSHRLFHEEGTVAVVYIQLSSAITPFALTWADYSKTDKYMSAVSYNINFPTCMLAITQFQQPVWRCKVGWWGQFFLTRPYPNFRNAMFHNTTTATLQHDWPYYAYYQGN